MIEFIDLNFSLNSKSILQDINLRITPGEFVAIIGPNGAGKSTLIKLLIGLLELQSGQILIEGLPHLEWLKKNGFGYLPQREEYDRSFPATALDIVLMGRMGESRPGSRFSASDRELAQQAMRDTGVESLAKRRIGALSGGEFQRVLLARAICTGSSILILDEPEASIDRPGVESFFELLAKLNQAGKTIITISHDLHTLSNYCSFLVCLNRTLHCHTRTELLQAEHISKTFGDAVHLIEKGY